MCKRVFKRYLGRDEIGSQRMGPRCMATTEMAVDDDRRYLVVEMLLYLLEISEFFIEFV